jgi:MFS family permease
VGRGFAATVRVARRASHAEGAGESGLSRLIELHSVSAAADAAVAISLAGTLFFQVPTDQARDQVALFLGLTMLPFAIVAPLIGPFLDRYSHGRRWAIGATFAARAFLVWNLAAAIQSDSVALFPAALGVLVASKAYGVTRAAAVPRVAPASLGLVKSNSRISLAGVTGAAVSAPIALVASTFGSDWSLRYAFVMFVIGTILAILLPARVDNAVDEDSVRVGKFRSDRYRAPSQVVIGLRCNVGLRMLSGFLTLFMAFLLRAEPFPGWEDKQALLVGLVIGSAGIGSTTGIALGSVLHSVKPSKAVVLALLADAVIAIVAAVFYALPIVLLLGFVAGLAQTFGKLSLDSLIQGQVPERGRASAFARSETLLQLAWVLGGFLGIALPLIPRLGLGTIAVILVLITVWVARGRRQHPA